MKIDVNALTFIVGVGIPFLVALVTKQRASSQIKAAANFVLSGLAAIALAGIQSKGILTQATALQAIVVFVTSGSSYQHLLQPLGLTNKVAAIAPNVGVGANDVASTDYGKAPLPQGWS